MEAKIAELEEEKESLEAVAAQAANAAASADNQSEDASDSSAVSGMANDGSLSDKLMQAYEAYQSGDIETCGTILMEMEDVDSLDTASRIIYDSISYTKDIVPDYWYEDAMKLFEQDNFAEALEGFRKVYEVANTTGESLYYMALCYYDLDQNDNAARYFQEYLDTYPAGPHVMECQWLLSQM